MIVLEKWDSKKPLSVIYCEGEKELFYIKRFLIENPEREESIISDHPKSYLEKIFTDYRPMAEVVFVKMRGQDRSDNLELNLDEFISIKGINAMGNQLTKNKVLEINNLEPLKYTLPEPKEAAEIDVVDEETVIVEKEQPTINEESTSEAEDISDDDEGQTSLF